MASVETLELQTFPIWSPQPDEPAEKYLIFERYFLPRVKANLTQAYRDYLIDQGKDGQAESVTCPPTSWRDDCDRFLWRSRHTAFWRWKNHNDQQWREEQIRSYQSESLDVARLLRFKALEILENFSVDQASPKDACQMIRLAGELVESGLDLGDLDRAVSVVFAAGLEVVSPIADDIKPN